MSAERMCWEAGPFCPPRPVPPLPRFWRTFPTEFETLEKVKLGRWRGDLFVIGPNGSKPITYRYIGEFGKGEALMQLIVGGR